VPSLTKKRSSHKWEISTILQEETVSNEFAFFDQGRHIQSLKISNNITDKIFATVGINRNDFAGFFDDKKGRDHQLNDGLRGYSWLPKEQIATNASLHYAEGNVWKNLNEFDKAVACYKKSIEVDPKYYFGTFAIGAAYYDRAVEIQTKAAEETDDAKYELMVKDLEKHLEMAIQPFEQCYDTATDNEVKSVVAETQRRVGEKIEAGNRTVTSGLTIARETVNLIKEINKEVSVVNSNIQEITVASDEQSKGAEQVAQAMLQIDQSTQMNASLSQRLFNNSKNLVQQTNELNLSIKNLKEVLDGK
jgi:tetratricopeptide (TPR) repeat protein